ncbi:type II toxin-antitoxin system HicB family antitoxin [Chroococcidiopsis sp. FACHB-1243]|uniref:type II toxin-antitoxin system HicB family antitoxin n=1 Tax=Chroococcidiopsis sp. [FACHB-1243] TaxID=2692781 RepID=UPI00177A9A62|nr:type II toxin-antitoxin system HicB family antitoxin [Chroococcidiopsis sp. [FACHB-1243]]MBD2307205.1 type II toxin-antitoxin system HicB family antitoxin [Chroococcidiopsis sp. [FACHB-1243]]
MRIYEYRIVMPCTHGKTREEVICNGEKAIEMYLEAWQAEGESIPELNTLQTAMIPLAAFSTT